MSTLEVFADANDGQIRSLDPTYSTARSGSNFDVRTSDSVLNSGQWWNDPFYYVWETFLSFDTSEIPDGALIFGVTLSFFCSGNATLNDRIQEVRLFDWGTSLTSADWISAANLGSYTLLASIADDAFTLNQYNDLTSESSFISNINKTGSTRVVVATSRARLGNTPTEAENDSFTSGDGTYRPKLTIEYGVPEEHDLEAILSMSTGLAALPAIGYVFQADLPSSFSLRAEVTGSFAMDFSRFHAYLEDADGHVGLIYHEGEGMQRSTVSRALQEARMDTGVNRFQIRPESGNTFSQGDFSGGAGQRYYHHEGSDPKRFLRSEGFDIRELSKLVHLNATATALSDVNAGVLILCGGVPMVSSGQDVKVSDGAFPGDWTDVEDPEDSGTPTTVSDLVASGATAIAALAAEGIHIRAPAGGWSHYSDLEATVLAWVKNRLMASDGAAMYEVVAGGAAPTAIKTLPEGWEFVDIFEAGSYVYGIAVNEDDVKSEIHLFGLNAENTAIEDKGSQEFPHGQILRAGYGYLNVTLLGAGRENADGGFDPVLYRAVPDDNGFLEYAIIAEEEGSGANDLSVKAFASLGDSIICGWSTDTGCAMGAARAGLGIYNIKNDAFAAYLRGTTSAQAVSSILVYGGRVMFVVDGVGVLYEDVDTLETEAVLITSVADWNNAGNKLWDQIEISHGPLPASTHVDVSYSTEIPEAATTWLQAFTSQTADSDGAVARLSSLEGRLFALKLESHADAAGPEIVGYGVRSNPLPDTPEFVLTRYIRLADKDRREPLAEEVNQDASAINARLLNDCYRWVRFYEEGSTWLARIEQVAAVPPNLAPFDPSAQNRKDLYVVQLVLSGTFV